MASTANAAPIEQPQFDLRAGTVPAAFAGAAREEGTDASLIGIDRQRNGTGRTFHLSAGPFVRRIAGPSSFSIRRMYR